MPTILCLRKATDFDELKNIVGDYFQTEMAIEIPPNKIEFKEDIRARDILEKTTKYEVGLLRKSNNSNLPDNLSIARKNIFIHRKKNISRISSDILILQFQFAMKYCRFM